MKVLFDFHGLTVEIDKDAKHIAMDQDGEINTFEDDPTMRIGPDWCEFFGLWYNEDSEEGCPLGYYTVCEIDPSTLPVDWKKSKMEIKK